MQSQRKQQGQYRLCPYCRRGLYHDCIAKRGTLCCGLGESSMQFSIFDEKMPENSISKIARAGNELKLKKLTKQRKRTRTQRSSRFIATYASDNKKAE